MKKYLCGGPGCGELLDAPGYCARHRREKAAARPFAGAARSNNYNTARWRRLAARVIRETPYCEACGASRKDGAALEAHHRDPPRGDGEKFFDENNLQILCRSCHRLATAREIRERKTGRGGDRWRV
jgi:5-methylcytosine-specific restriction protein A